MEGGARRVVSSVDAAVSITGLLCSEASPSRGQNVVPERSTKRRIPQCCCQHFNPRVSVDLIPIRNSGKEIVGSFERFVIAQSLSIGTSSRCSWIPF
jgi:hypothetical protein